ncbi:UDP-3-O-(3-hydroxymyristoyl)glucosamine N-acyltransferase [Comamonas sp. Y6]|uniref:UDP-3-O-(3-hydroxymyristoyl)glucosamine N-acyltransferase n=1 Tax=Comamonas resistens TaxID=3046670 RepID=A0ABY8SSJ1_9BURK|nr:UDP-3-O-(3-hydroxymyristoyl)glucosamine N-acyltransferase [Comamonas resistens]MDL5039208.1 UDP-3-O-(3-hydroxymyristoyl)glucosamine N-acyltransferase [Comamonas resistens]WHS66013.1 UDP-3-O-(3-hydroxymyristoyl)glucosamine N-acyltransferase [Comamonas resistens]
MAYKWIIGSGTFLEVVHDAWHRAHPNLQLEKISISQNAIYEFDLGALDALSPAVGTAFVAFDERFCNFKRQELMSALVERGFALEPFISPRALLASNVQVEPNAFIGDGAIVGWGSHIGSNSILLPGSQVGCNVDIQSACWLEAGTHVGDGAHIGAHCTLRNGALVAPRIRIGACCELGWPQRYSHDVAEKTYFDPRYDQPIYTYNS